MRRTITFTATFTLFGCGVINFGDSQNDTQLGDDDGDGGTADEDGGEDPSEIVDHGIAQYCVDRWKYNAEVSMDMMMMVQADEVAKHERWWSPKRRSYVNYLDISDKPSPMIVPPMCGVADPLWPDAWDDPQASCLVSGYHVQLPSVVTAPGPGAVQWPYGANLVTGTIGNPPESGRHTWMAEQCCSTPPTPEELETWGLALMDDEKEWLRGSKHADCGLHAMIKGAQPDALDYVSPYDPISRVYKIVSATQCVDNYGVFNPAVLVPYKAASLGSWLPFHPTVQQHTVPLNLNYDWIASWGLIEWDDFAAFGSTIDAVVVALLSVLYLPPAGFEHPRYGGGSGCFYPVSLKYGPNGWAAEITCPVGYYEELPAFDEDDLATQIDGVVGHCMLDGYGAGPFGDGGEPVIAAPPEMSGSQHLYYVYDQELVAKALDAAWLEGSVVTEELAGLFLDPNGQPFLNPGDVIRWWSMPGVDGLSPGEAFLRTVRYDVDDLMKATGWTREEAERWADSAPPVRLDRLLKIPLEESLASRYGHQLRARNTWRMMITQGSIVRPFYVRAA